MSVQTLSEEPVATVVAEAWSTLLGVLATIRQEHEEEGAVEGETGLYAWAFDAPKGLLTIHLAVEREPGIRDLWDLNHVTECVQFLRGDEPGRVLATVRARCLPELTSPESFKRAARMLDGGGF